MPIYDPLIHMLEKNVVTSCLTMETHLENKSMSFIIDQIL